MKTLRYSQIIICSILFIGNITMLFFSLFFRKNVYTGTSLNFTFQNWENISLIILCVLFVINLVISIKSSKQNIIGNIWTFQNIFDLVIAVILCVSFIISVNCVNQNIENGIPAGNLPENMNSSKLIFWLMLSSFFSWYMLLSAKYVLPKSMQQKSTTNKRISSKGNK